MTQTYQSGYLFKLHGAWYVRYRENVTEANGSIVRRQIAQRLASVNDYPRRRDAIRLRDAFMTRVNCDAGFARPAITLDDFVESLYLPHIEREKRASTLKGYRETWRNHFRSCIGRSRLRDFRTVDASNVMEDIARARDLSSTTLKHLKAMLSGVFRYAKNKGLYDGVNPVQGVLIPRARGPQPTYAYSLQEILRILHLLDPSTSPELSVYLLMPETIVAVAAFAGLRSGEIKGVQWTDYTSDALEVKCSVWRGIVNSPKRKCSQAAVPVIEPLRKLLDAHRAAMGNPASGRIFPGLRKATLDLDWLGRKVIKPVIEREHILWHGWHAFRRGIASNLYSLGASDKVVQAILRHASVEVTREHYIKAFHPDVVGAMKRLETAVGESCATVVQRVN